MVNDCAYSEASVVIDPLIAKQARNNTTPNAGWYTAAAFANYPVFQGDSLMAPTPPGSSSAAPQGVKSATVQQPLTLVMTIKSDNDYQALSALLTKIQSAPPEQNPIWKALTILNNVHFARFVFLEQNTKLAVITTYDGTFEDYINEFIDAIGDVFNALLAHMKDGPQLPVQQNRDQFLNYVRSNDLRAIEPFYSAYPKATVLDIKAALGQ